MKKYQFQKLLENIKRGRRPALIGRSLSFKQYKKLSCHINDKTYIALLLSRVSK